MSLKKLYISPANHRKEYIKPDGKTKYPISEWNEKKNSEIIADELNSFLSNFKIEVYLDKTDRSGGKEQYYGRPEEANKWFGNTNKSETIYLALHSNAGAGGGTNARGSVVYYNAKADSKLASTIGNSVDLILPKGSNRSNKTIKGNYASGVSSWDGNLGELRVPEENNSPSVLIEVAFHDNPVEADFLISNQKKIANAIGNELVKFYNLEKKSGGTTIPVINEGNKIKIKSGAKYTNNANVPSWAIGVEYTASKIKPDSVLVEEILSWVKIEYIELIEKTTPSTTPPTTLSPPITNIGVGSSWSVDARKWCIDNGIFIGDGKGNYDWNGTCTREMLAQVVYNLNKK